MRKREINRIEPIREALNASRHDTGTLWSVVQFYPVLRQDSLETTFRGTQTLRK